MRYILLILLTLLGPALAAQNTARAKDSLLHVLKKTSSPQVKIGLYRHLADLHLDESQAKIYLLRMYQEASAINDKNNMLEALNDIIIEEISSYNKDSVMKYTNLLNKIATPKETESMLPFYHIRIVDSQLYTGKREEVIEQELSFLHSPQNNVYTEPYKEMVSSYIMGNSLYANKEFTKAIPYIEKSMKLIELLPEYKRYDYYHFIAWRMCYTYARAGREKEGVQLMANLINIVEQRSRTYYQKKRPFYKIEFYLLQDYSFMMASLRHLTIEQEQHYWGRIQQLKSKLTSDLSKYSYYLSANNYYSSNRTKIDLPKAIAANDSLINIAKVLGPQNLPGLYQINSALYERSKNYAQALECLKTSHHIYDSLNTDASRKQLNELQVKYDLNNLNNEKIKLEVRNKSTQLAFVCIMLIVLISVCTYLYFSLKREKRMKAKLKVLNHKAQESENMKKAFINSVCHEIRTPLNSIVGFADLIMNEDIDEELRREFPCEIQKSTVLLTSLINSMLEVANLDVSDEKLPCKPADIRNICTEEIKVASKKENIVYQLDIPEEEFIVSTNHQYLAQVISQLLDNANKFTDTGSITLSCQMDAMQQQVIIRITDTGCGIPKEKYEEVFERFTKLDTFTQGSGLGLYLCRLIVKRLAGTIKIDTTYTQGASMVVTLPID